jgi:hypothetical protein
VIEVIDNGIAKNNIGKPFHGGDVMSKLYKGPFKNFIENR